MRLGSLVFACANLNIDLVMNSIPAESGLIVLIIRLDFDCVKQVPIITILVFDRIKVKCAALPIQLFCG